MPRCEIALPTYNRPECVERRIREVEQHSDVLASIAVSDNSPEVDEVAAQLAARHGWVRYSRNEANIGGGANFMRAIERADADYIWLRGDDDPITQGQIDAARRYFSEEPQLIILSPNGGEPYFGQGMRDFAEHFSEIRSIGWLSCIVFPGKVAKAALPWGYWGVHTGWANVCLVLGLFRAKPDLKFVVSPFRMEEGDFREVGREKGGRWAFFTTCIQKFPATAGVISDPKDRALYLARWRATQRFSLCKTMVRQLAGLGGTEHLSRQTFRPLFSLGQPKAFALGLTLWAMTLVPQVCWQVLLTLWSFRQSPAALSSLGLEWLAGETGLSRRLAAIRRHAKKETVGAFL